MRALPFLRILTGIAVGIATTPVFAADLLSIYREAQKEDAVFAAARANLAAGQEKLPQGLSGLLPAVTLSGNTLYNDRDLQFRNGTPSANARFNANALNVTATQPLFRAQSWITYEQAKNQVTQAEAAFLQANHDLMIRVAQAYFDVLLAENNVSLEAALVSSQSSLDSTKLGQEVGVRTQVDVLNAQQQLITTRRDYAQAIYGYAVNVLKLKAAAGTLAEADLAYVNQWLGN